MIATVPFYCYTIDDYNEADKSAIHSAGSFRSIYKDSSTFSCTYKRLVHVRKYIFSPNGDAFPFFNTYNAKRRIALNERQ